jgi:hypothetical protein
MKKLLLCLMLALALSACQPSKINLEPLPVVPEHRRNSAPALPVAIARAGGEFWTTA